ncbi:MAG: FIST N-terminal domain-containing protein [Planctomycetota bacterium]
MTPDARSTTPATAMGAGLSPLEDAEHAANQACTRAAEQLGERTAGLVFVFFSAAHRERAGLIASASRRVFPDAAIVGCSAESVLAGTTELERRPGISVLASALPGVEARVFPLERIAAVEPRNPSRTERLRASLGMTHEHRATFVLADPFGTPLAGVLAGLDAASSLGLADEEPRPPIMGGVASANNRAGGNAFLIDGAVIRDGGVGVSLNGPVRVDCVVSQGCRPIGENHVVTRARGNVIYELGGRRAFDIVRETIAEMPEEDRQLLARGVFLGVAVDEHRPRFGRGDFAIRGVVSADEGDGSIAISENIRVGQTVRMHARDAETAHEDLELLLDAQKLHDHPAGCLLVTCNGRGTRLFDQPNHDANVVRRAFETVRRGSPVIGPPPQGPGAPMPIAGFFAAGEIGPIQGRPLLHGHTACAALFRGVAP